MNKKEKEFKEIIKKSFFYIDVVHHDTIQIQIEDEQIQEILGTYGFNIKIEVDNNDINTDYGTRFKVKKITTLEEEFGE